MTSLRSVRILLFSPELAERTYPGRPPIYYLSSFLRRAGFEDVLTIDVDITGQKHFVDTLRRFEPDIIAATSLSVQINETIRLLKIAKRICPHAVTILGGTHATAAGDFLYPVHRNYLDGVVIGEGLTAIQTIARIVEEGNWESRKGDVPGLLYWDGAAHGRGKLPVPEKPEHYDPDLSWHHSSYDFSIFARADGRARRTFQMMTSFGCENSCFFCTSSVNKHNESRRGERRMSLATVDRILQEASNRGFEAVYFDDDTFTRDRAHAIAVAQLAKKHKLVFGCHTRPDCEDDHVIEELARNGCLYMFSGLETIVPEILLGSNKTTDPIAYRAAYQRSYAKKKALGLPTSAFMVHGMPRRITQDRNTYGNDNAGSRGRITWQFDSVEDSTASVTFAVRELDPTYLSMNVLRFIPGVPFSTSPRFEFMRPVKGELHGGYFDDVWLRENGIENPRCSHPILRAFEGAGSPIPRHMTPQSCYEILRHTVDTVNGKNAEPGRNQTRIVVDPWFERRFLHKNLNRGVLHYELASFDSINRSENAAARRGISMAVSRHIGTAVAQLSPVLGTLS